MGVFDLLFIVLLLVTMVTLAVAAIAAIKGDYGSRERVARARHANAHFTA